MTFREFWNDNEITELFVAGTGCPAGLTYTHNVDTDVDEDYCDLGDLIDSLFPYGAVSAESDTWEFESAVWELEGDVTLGRWNWNGEGRISGMRGGDYHQIVLIADSAP